MKLTKMPIMKLGTHTAMDGRAISFTTDMLNDIAGSYDPQLSESPIVIGHPTLTAPAYGWVKQTSVEDGTLYAHVGQVDAAFAEAVNEGRYKNVVLQYFYLILQVIRSPVIIIYVTLVSWVQCHLQLRDSLM